MYTTQVVRDEYAPTQIAKPPAKHEPDEVWLKWIEGSQAALLTLVDTLGEHEGGAAAVAIAK